MNILSSFLIISLLISIPIAFGEDYYYIPDHKLETPPVFCAMEFEDERLPIAEPQLMEITKNAIFDWRNKLIEATGNTEGWDFQFKQISLKQQQELFFDNECTVNIYFERIPPEGQWDYMGYADSYLTFSDIYIFYLEPIYEYKGKTEIIDGEEWEIAEVTGFTNILTYDLRNSIPHEIGHSLGLDHPKFESYQFVKESFDVLKSPSIMIDLTKWDITGDLRMKITDYDVRSVINLYGEDGINEINLWAFWDIIIIVIFLMILVFIVNRKFRKNYSDVVPLD